MFKVQKLYIIYYICEIGSKYLNNTTFAIITKFVFFFSINYLWRNDKVRFNLMFGEVTLPRAAVTRLHLELVTQLQQRGLGDVHSPGACEEKKKKKIIIIIRQARNTKMSEI